MKKLLTLALIFSSVLFASAQTTWKKEQLMPTKELADKINANGKDIPLIFNVGPMEAIKTSKSIGLGTSISAMDKLKSNLSMESKTRTVVVYCGCCSYANCPNIKPAYDALIAAGFKNAKVLDLPEGIKPDWVAKGFPMQE